MSAVVITSQSSTKIKKTLNYQIFIAYVLLGVLLFHSVTCEMRKSNISLPKLQNANSQIKVAVSQDKSITFPSVCYSNCSKELNNTETFKYCDTSNTLKMEGRCCVNATHDPMSSDIVPVYGIDLQDCGMTEEHFANGIQNLSVLVVISLEGNPIENITATDFNQNTGIMYLSLPSSLSCPGGINAWSEIENTSSIVICKDELNACRENSVSCPDNSHCVPAGIEATECLCDKGYHGYKCLNKGRFPFLPYAIGLATPTIFLAIFLWLTQRRYVKKTK